MVGFRWVWVEVGLSFLILFLIDTVDFNPHIFHQFRHFTVWLLIRCMLGHDKLFFHIISILLGVVGVSGISKGIFGPILDLNIVKKLLSLLKVRMLVEGSVMLLVIGGFVILSTT